MTTPSPESASRKRFLSKTAAGALGTMLLVLLVAGAEIASRYAPHTWINRDGRFYTNTNVTLAESGSLDQDEFCASWYEGNLGWNRNLDAGWSNVAEGRDGRVLPKHPILMPLLAMPLFWAFGLHGTLLFNLLVFGLAGAGAFLFLRRRLPEGHPPRAGPQYATAAILIFLGATSLRGYAYDYNVDVLILAFWLLGLGALSHGRGVLAGLFVGAAVVLKPTTLMWMPTLLLLGWEQKDRRALVGALVAGTVVLGLFALTNHWLFGRPWWTGYNRTIVVINGASEVVSHADVFDVPLRDGLERNWSGYWGLRHHFTLWLPGVLGLPLLARRRPLYVVAAVLGLLFSQLVFGIYRFEGHRFQWPALALLLPAYAALLEALSEGLRKVHRSLETLSGPSRFGPVLLGLALLAQPLFFGDAPLDRIAPAVGNVAQVAQSSWVLGSEALAAGHLDLRGHVDEGTLGLWTQGDASPITRSRYGHWAARTPLPAMLLGAPFAALGRGGLVLLLLLAGLSALVGFGRLFSVREGSLKAAGVAVTLLFALPTTQRAMLEHAPELLGLGAAVWALVPGPQGQRHRFFRGAMAALAAMLLASPWVALALLVPAVVGSTRRNAEAAVAAGAFGAAVLGNLAWHGRPFATADDFVIVGGQSYEIATAAWSELPSLSVHALLLAVALFSLLLALVLRNGALPSGRLLGSGALLGTAVLAHSPLLLDAGAIALGVTCLAHAVDLWPLLSGRSLGGLSGGLLLVLLVVGTVRLPREEGFRLESYEGVRRAEVHLGTIPCDFLAWEHLTWECATFDRGLRAQTGLLSSNPPHYGGVPEPRFYAAATRRPRRVRWTLPAAGTFEITTALPDGVEAANLHFRLNGGPSIAAPLEGSERRQSLSFEAEAGAILELEVQRGEVGLTGAYR